MKCEKDCPSNAIDISQGTINDTCIHCGHCIAICPENAVTDKRGKTIPLEQPTITSHDFKNLSSNLRSCRSYLKKEVDTKTIRALIENIKYYPSASNARPVKITVVNTPEKVQRLNDLTTESLIKMLSTVTGPILNPILKIVAPKLNIEGLARYKEKFIENQKTNSSQVCHHAPVVLLFHAPASKMGMAKEDAYIWATYTSLYAKTMGLGTCFIGFITMAMGRNKRMRQEFKIPETHQVHAALTLGYPKMKYHNETMRLEPRVNWI